MTTEIDSKKIQRAKAYYETGLDAAQKRNLDYALQMLSDACRLMPTHLPYRQGLRATQRLKYENDPGKVGMMAKARVQPISLQIRITKSTGSWLKALETCEDAFVLNPWDVHVAMEAAECALELGAPELAEWNLASVADEAEDKVSYLRLKARIYEALGKWAAAIRCFEIIRELVPGDQDVTSKINSLSAKGMMARSGMDSGSKQQSQPLGGQIGENQPGHEVRVVQDQKDSAGSANADANLSPEDRLKKLVEQNPTDIRVVLQLADLYKSSNRLDEADRTLNAALKVAPNDLYLRLNHADTRLERMARALEQWDKHIADHPADAEATVKRTELVRKRNEFEINEFQRRIAISNADAESHFRLGTALARADRLDEAIAAFQQARNSSDWKVKALTEAGQCFEKVGSAKLAERSYTDALKSVPADDTATFNNLHYRLGCLAERNGQLQPAEEHFNEVAATDYGYKDVAKRLRDIQSRM